MVSTAGTLRLETLFGTAAKATDQTLKCDFNCGKKDEKLLLLINTNGHRWVYHLSCLKEHIEAQEVLGDQYGDRDS